MDEQTLTMVFTLDNGDNYNINVDFPKDNLNKATVDAVMQKFIDKRAITKDGHVAEAIKEAALAATDNRALHV